MVPNYIAFKEVIQTYNMTFVATTIDSDVQIGNP